MQNHPAQINHGGYLTRRNEMSLSRFEQQTANEIVRHEIKRQAAVTKAQIDFRAVALALAAALDEGFSLSDYAQMGASSNPAKQRLAAQVMANWERLAQVVIDLHFAL